MYLFWLKITTHKKTTKLSMKTFNNCHSTFNLLFLFFRLFLLYLSTYLLTYLSIYHSTYRNYHSRHVNMFLTVEVVLFDLFLNINDSNFKCEMFFFYKVDDNSVKSKKRNSHNNKNKQTIKYDGENRRKHVRSCRKNN